MAIWSAGIFGLLLLTAAVNVVMDPYGLWRLIDRSGFNQQKEGVRSKIRFTKSLELPLRRPRTVLLGSSRVHDGLNPDHFSPEQKPVYNMGVDLLRVREGLFLLRHVSANAHPECVIFGLDFFMFNAAERMNPSLDPELTGRRVRFLDYVLPLLSINALGDSLRTLQISRAQPNRREFLSNGYRPGTYVFYRLLDYPRIHDYTNWIFLSDEEYGTPYYGRFWEDGETYADLDEFMGLCRTSGIDCRFFISPAHCTLDGEGIRLAGLWENMEDWKRRLTVMAARHEVPLWDFSGYNLVTTEPVRSPMANFWDSSHFTEAVGDRIIDRVAGPEGPAGRPGDFGVRLSPDSVEAHLAAVRRAREAYVAEDHPEVRAIRTVHRNIKADKKQQIFRGIFASY